MCEICVGWFRCCVSKPGRGPPPPTGTVAKPCRHPPVRPVTLVKPSSPLLVRALSPVKPMAPLRGGYTGFRPYFGAQRRHGFTQVR